MILKYLRKSKSVTFYQMTYLRQENKYAGKLYTYFYPAMTAFTDQYSLPNIFLDIGQL